MDTKNANPSILSLLISTLKTISDAYPDKAFSFTFDSNSAGGDYLVTHLWDAPDGKLYLWAMPDADKITFCPTDTYEIEDAGICTRELTTAEGLTIVIAEDF